jgi:demethylmenaquinone methyltransferase / 2-methoxy-6-polyprenyl-1,4-benzoquinol methylase
VDDRIWLAEGDRKREAVRQMFAEIAPRYDLVNGLMSLSLHRRWRALAVEMLQLQPGDRAADVCCGTGDFLPPLRKAIGDTGELVGVDFCPQMLERAEGKTADALALGDACGIPLQSGRFHGVTVGWGIRNVPDIDAAHREIARILAPGGRFVSIDMARPLNSVVRAVSRFAFNTLVPVLGRLFGSRDAYTYLPQSTERFWSREELAASMERAGFTEVRTRDLFLGNICIHFGRKPR